MLTAFNHGKIQSPPGWYIIHAPTTDGNPSSTRYPKGNDATRMSSCDFHKHWKSTRLGLRLKKRRLFAKKRYTWSLWRQNRYNIKPSTNHASGALRLASFTSYLFWGVKSQIPQILSALSSFQVFLAKFELIRGHTFVPRHVSYDVS